MLHKISNTCPYYLLQCGNDPNHPSRSQQLGRQVSSMFRTFSVTDARSRSLVQPVRKTANLSGYDRRHPKKELFLQKKNGHATNQKHNRIDLHC